MELNIEIISVIIGAVLAGVIGIFSAWYNEHREKKELKSIHP